MSQETPGVRELETPKKSPVGRPVRHEPVQFALHISGPSEGEGAGDRDSADDDETISVARLQAADALVIHPVFVLEALEAVQAHLQQARDHICQIAVAMPDELHAGLEQWGDAPSEMRKPEAIEQLDAHQHSSRIGHVVIQAVERGEIPFFVGARGGAVIQYMEIGLQGEVPFHHFGIEDEGHEVIGVAILPIVQSREVDECIARLQHGGAEFLLKAGLLGQDSRARARLR